MSQPTPGRFISFEGGEGCGKSTQARLLTEALQASGHAALSTREPGGAPGAETLRDLLLSGDTPWSPLAETLLHFAARAQHVAETVQPALIGGRWVVCDRFTDSTIAYQGAGMGMPRPVIDALIGMIGLRPDLTIVMDVSDGVRADRLAARGRRADHYERQPPQFQDRVNAAFRDIAAAEPARCLLLPADDSIDAVHRAVLRAVRDRLLIAV